MKKYKILVVEDDTAVRNLITTALETQDYQYLACQNGKEAILEAVSHNPNALMLDLGLPDMDGMEIIQKIRGWSNMPILVVSGRRDEQDIIAALDAGADDYIIKPFSVGELMARLRVALRRLSYMNGVLPENQKIFVNAAMRIDYVASCVYLSDKELHLTPIEYKILTLLAKNVGKVLPHAYITEEIWGHAWQNDVSSLRVFMATLRRKLEKMDQEHTYIETRVGIGYRMVKL